MKLFVWDFHGVMEKGNERAAGQITNLILKQHGYKVHLTPKQSHEFYGIKWYQYFERLLPKESHEKHLQLQLACRTFQQSHPVAVRRYIKPNDHITEVVKAISTKHDQIIVSNSHPESLEFFIKVVNLQRYFPRHKAFGTNSHEGPPVTKKTHFLDYIKDKNFEDFIFIGDSPEDIELALIAGGKTYLYAHPGQPHKQVLANYKINDLREVLKEV